MKSKKGYKSLKISFSKTAVNASSLITMKRNSIHGIIEVDITEPRRLLKYRFEKTGEKLSLTTYIVACVAQVVKANPLLNSFKRGRRIIILDDIVISVLVERDINGEMVPEPLGIKQADKKTLGQIQNEIRKAKEIQSDMLGSISGHTWIRFIPKSLLKQVMRFVDKSVFVAKRYGKISVIGLGMFSNEPLWFIPPGSTTVQIIAGGINQRVVEIDGEFVSREHICLTVSFDHNVVDGAPATRFLNQLSETIKSGLLLDVTNS